jgi:hypothetical protein
MEHDQASRRDDPADPVTATPEEIAATRDGRDAEAGGAEAGGAEAGRRDGDADPNRKADTTKEATVEPPD